MDYATIEGKAEYYRTTSNQERLYNYQSMVISILIYIVYVTDPCPVCLIKEADTRGRNDRVSEAGNSYEITRE